MATTMHRLQISLPNWQHQFLVERARRDGVSVAEVIRLLIEREATSPAAGGATTWDISGIAEDHGPLIRRVPVSESPEAYLAEISRPSRPKAKRRARR